MDSLFYFVYNIFLITSIVSPVNKKTNIQKKKMMAHSDLTRPLCSHSFKEYDQKNTATTQLLFMCTLFFKILFTVFGQLYNTTWNVFSVFCSNMYRDLFMYYLPWYCHKSPWQHIAKSQEISLCVNILFYIQWASRVQELLARSHVHPTGTSSRSTT